MSGAWADAPMRALTLLLAAALLAGCSDDARTDPTPTVGSPTPSAPPTASPSPTPEPTPDPTPSPAPPPEPTTLYERAFDFQAEATPAPEGKAETFVVGDAVGTVTVNLSTTSHGVGGQPVSIGVQPTIEVYDPSGDLVLSITGVPRADEATVPATEGEWRVVFKGAGNADGHVLVTGE